MEKPLQCPSCHFLAALVNNVSFGMYQGHFFSFYVINAQHTVITIEIQFMFVAVNTFWLHSELVSTPAKQLELQWISQLDPKGTVIITNAPKHELFSFVNSLLWLQQDIKFFCFLTVIGGYNIYLRMGISGECDKKYSIWEALKKEVLYVVLQQSGY